MKSSGRNIELASVDDLFSTQESREDARREKVVELPLTQVHAFRNHPFKVTDDQAMMDLAASISARGVKTPALARPDPCGGYELISGHRRHRACQLAGLDTIPVIVREMDDDEATIAMVEANLQREVVLPSERAFAYKMKRDALMHQGIASPQVGEKLLTVEVIGKELGDSKNQVLRYIRLTELVPKLLDMVDQKTIAFNPAYELSFLTKAEQVQLMDVMEQEQATPSLSQAQRLKRLSQEGRCTPEVMCSVLREAKKPQREQVTLSGEVLEQYFPKSYTPKRMEQTILALLEQWQRRRQQNLER